MKPTKSINENATILVQGWVRFVIFALMSLCMSSVIAPSFAQDATNESSLSASNAVGPWYEEGIHHVSKTWQEGSVEIYLPFATLHMPFAYTPDQRKNYNELPLGLGAGRGRINSNGNYEGVFGMVFQDSHSRTEYTVGYAWIPTWTVHDTDMKVGVGLAGIITARSDIGNYMPFPAVLPVASISAGNFSIQAAYVPGGKGNGNVLFAWAKWSFN